MNMMNVVRRAFVVLIFLLPGCKPPVPPTPPDAKPPTKTDSPTTKPPADADPNGQKPRAAPAEAPPKKTDAAVEKPVTKSDAPVAKLPAKTDASAEVKSLVDMLCALPMWRTSRDFTTAEWDQFIAAARRIQSSNPDHVRAAITTSAPCAPPTEPGAIDTDYLRTSKEFILLRVAFDVPETVPPEYPNKFWLRSATSPWDVSWPVRWRNGRPEQTARYAGFEGFAYIPVGEWEHFKAEFPFRKLPPP